MIPTIVAAIDQQESRGSGGARSSRAIAGVIGRMISDGTFEPGAQLPTVRQLSKALGVSPTTVSEAWRALSTAGAIETRGRNGTFVRAGRPSHDPRRYRGISAGPGRFDLDLSSGIPDPALLPDLGPVVARVSRQSLTSSYVDQPVLPELSEAVLESWPFEADELTVVDGALDALDRVSQLIVRLGDRVIVEDPCFPPTLDLLDRLGCDVIGVALDDEGVRLDEFEQALAHDPAAIFLQPRAQNPSSGAMSAARAADLATLLTNRRAIVVEDDHANDISGAPLVSIGSYHPDRTVHIRSFSKSHGPDLRLAAVGGAGEILHMINSRRMLGPGWSSRILQAVLLELLADANTADTIANARATYDRRRTRIADILNTAGIEHRQGDGINLWLPVAHEQSALVTLASQGIGAAPGSPFMIAPTGDHLRVTVGLIPDDRLDAIGDTIVDAALAGNTTGGSR